MFVTTPQQQVLALNAKTGDLIWRYRKELPEDLLQLHPTNRGVELEQILRRSEEHTSELQSLTNLVCRLLLEKKKAQYGRPREDRNGAWRDSEFDQPMRK